MVNNKRVTIIKNIVPRRKRKRLQQTKQRLLRIQIRMTSSRITKETTVKLINQASRDVTLAHQVMDSSHWSEEHKHVNIRCEGKKNLVVITIQKKRKGWPEKSVKRMALLKAASGLVRPLGMFYSSSKLSRGCKSRNDSDRDYWVDVRMYPSSKRQKKYLFLLFSFIYV